MREIDPASIQAISFDCYGTLIDWERGILAALASWRKRTGLRADDEAILAAFADAEPQAEEAKPAALYPEILHDAFDRLAAALKTPAPAAEERDAFATSVGDWPAFPDTPAALRALKERCKLVILSNVDRASFARTNERLGVAFDAIITAEDVGAYKPDARMFQALERTMRELGVSREAHLHAAQSLHHDIAPANAVGMSTCWVDRRRGRAGGATKPIEQGAARPDIVVRSLAELAERMGA